MRPRITTVSRKKLVKHGISASASEVRSALNLVRGSEIGDSLPRAEAEDRTAANKRGARGPWLGYDAVMAIFFVLALTGRPLNKDTAKSLICQGLDQESLALLGIDLGALTPEQVYDRLDRSYTRMMQIMDPHPGPRNRKLTRKQFEEIEAAHDPEARAQRQGRLDEVCNRILLQTYRRIPRTIRRRYKGNVAVDGTFVPAFGQRRNSSRSEYMSIEPYAGHYIREGDHRDDPRRRKVTKEGWGWDGHFAVMTTNDPYRQATFPLIVIGMAMDRPGYRPGPHAITALKHIHSHGLPAGHLVGDRVYGNFPTPESFQVPARAMGYSLVYDMREIFLGKTYDLGFAIILEGNLYCPCIKSRTPLINATLDFRGTKDHPKRIDARTYDARLKERTNYLVQAHSAPHPDGSVQVRCPAAGNNPTVTCPLRPRDLEAELGVTGALLPITPKDLPFPEVRGGLCNNSGGTQVVRGEEVDRHLMAPGIQFGTNQWRAHYSVPRQTIESFNASVKNESGPALAAPGRRRTRGYAAAYLFTALLVAAANIHKINDWLVEPVEEDARGRGPEKPLSDRNRDQTWGLEALRSTADPPVYIDTGPTNTEAV